MTATLHVTVCICTFKRPLLLRRLLDALVNQVTNNAFTYSVVVADNDRDRSGEATVAAVLATTSLSVRYCVEPLQNIALTRNRALKHARGDLVAFIDDDEIPEADWLYRLFSTSIEYAADGVLGPVKPYFDTEPPSWVTKGKFFDRPAYATGRTIAWFEARTGNVLFNRTILTGVDTPFRPEFDTTGEDVDFFRRMVEDGRRFVWCDKAIVHELVPPSRCTRRYLLRRAMLRGSNFHKHPRHRLRNAAKSIIAVPCYTVALPVLALFGQHLFIAYLIKLLDHTSRLFAFAGVTLITTRET